MANNPKKSMDPTEAALSAIQEALNIRDDENRAEIHPDSMPLATARADGGSRVSGQTSPAFNDGYQTDAELGTLGAESQSLHAANDDQQSIGQILHALQRRPPRTSYFVAAIFSGVWLVGCLALSWAYLSQLNAALGPDHSPVGIMVGLGAAALLPVIFFFGVAHMAWRAQELRLIAQSMAKVAMRLAEPEGVARDSIVTVGQAIRREVAAMGDGVERALARAGELEALVQNEVAALERSYSDNEVRIRGLLQDLANQRDAMVGQAEQVRAAISNVHIDLTQDLSTISDLVGQQVNEAAQRITHSLAEKGEHITSALGQVGDNMIQQLSLRGDDLIVRLETASDETSRAIATAGEQLTSSLNFKTDHIGEDFLEIARGLEDMMTSRLDQVTERFSEKSLATVDMMIGRSQEITDLVSGRAQELTEAIIDTSSNIAETIATRADEVNSTLKSSGESLILDLNLRGGEVAKQLEKTGSQITESLISRSTTLTDSLRESAEQIVEAISTRTTKATDSLRDSSQHLADVIATRSDAVKDMLSARLAAFEEMFNHSGAELGEKISRDSSTLGNLITRHLAEFDRTVKTYGAELVERLGARTQDVSESMRGYVDNFDNRVTSKAGEVTAALDQRLNRFQEALDGRTQTLTEALAARVMDIAKTLSEGGKEVVTALDKRLSDVTTLIDTRAASLSDTVSARVANIDTTLGARATAVANTLDGRIGQLEQLLVGRAEAVSTQIETRSRAAADLLHQRLQDLSESIQTNTGSAERALVQLTTSTTELVNKSTTASTAAAETLKRSAAEATVSLSRSADALSSTISKSAAAASELIGKSIASAGNAIGTSATEADQAIGKTSARATEAIGKSATAANDSVGKAIAAASQIIAKSTESANETIGKTTTTTTNLIAKSVEAANESIGKATTTATDFITKSALATTQAIGRSASEAERTLVGTSAEVARNIVGKADEINNAITTRMGAMSNLLDEKSNVLLTALANKGQDFAGEVSRVTDHAVKSIEAKSFVFTQTMMDNSEEIARLINDASQSATSAVTRTLNELQMGAQTATGTAKSTISQTLQDLHVATKAAAEETKQVASATVADMLETHTMLRTDSTALFERLREANILLQEVLSAAHENMNSIEHTMASRVSEFVAAMSDLTNKSGATATKVEQQVGTFNTVTVKVLHDLGEISTQFATHGRSLTEAAELLDRSNRQTADHVATRQTSIESMITMLDERTADFGQRLQRFSGLLEESLDSAMTRTREIASLIAETSNDSVQTIEQQFDLVRTTSEQERKRTSETLNAVYGQAMGEVQGVFTQSAERFAEIMRGMKQMALEMQQELEATRTELRRGILELPQETAESAAQMRRVIVDQIEALAELNRIVARHGRALDAAEPMRREAEPAYATGGGRGQVRPIRPDITPQSQAGLRDITGAPTRRPEAPPPGQAPSGNGRGGGWLTDLLSRASRDDSPPIAPPVSRETARGDERTNKPAVDSIESLSVDVARMVDQDAAAELWERYKRGERGLFTRRLYTAQGQKAFDEIRNKYRGDPEFRQTVEHYIHEFERLLDDVARGDRGPTVVRNYLTSDTGKVYTMLAHAAGRFDQ